MADYNDLKVTELKEELKKRNIATTGLTRKQQIIDRLIEDDNEKNDSQPVSDVENVAEDATTVLPEPETVEQQNALEKAPEDVNMIEPAESKEDILAENKVEITTENNNENPNVQLEQPIAASETAPETAPETVPEIATETTPSAPNDVVMEEPAQDTTNITEQEKATAALENTKKDESAQDLPVSPSQNQTEDGTPDSRKRKRRSVTPPISEETVNKKLKQVEDTDGQVVQIQNDTIVPVNGTGESKDESNVEMPDAPAETTGAALSNENADASHPLEPSIETTNETVPRRLSSSKANRSPNQRRFKDIINPSSIATDSTNLPSSTDDDVQTSPALHPATRALYVRDLLRPINLGAFRDHLEHLATPPGQSLSGDLVQECYVDTLKTHAFVFFDSISSASRARASLHARVWPAEAQRKQLWVDFIPEEKMTSWIEQERAEGGARASTAKRWEVLYDAIDGDVDVRLVEAAPAGSGGALPQRPFAQGMPGAPIGPRASLPSGGHQRQSSFSQGGDGGSNNDRRRSSVHLPPPPRPSARAVEEASAPFLELDKLFRFTTAKPKLYWQPVSDDIADKRLDELDRETSRDWDPREDARINGNSMGKGLDQLKRYTFEDGDVLVDGGPEFGGGAAFGRGGESYRGSGGGGGGGRRRGADRYR